MNKTLKKLILFLCFFMFALSFLREDVYATEEQDINDIAKRQTNDSNKGQLYLNEPLDNAVPVIYKYEIEGNGYLVPGEEFKLKFIVYNPAVVSKLGNIRIMAINEDNLIYPKYGNTNSVYLGYLDPLSYTEGEISLVASKDITDKELPVNLVMSYTDNYKAENSLQLEAVLPVLKTGKLSVEKIDIPSSMHVGANNRLTMTYRNNGLSTVNDVTLHVKGDGITEKVQNMGSIGNGTSRTSDSYLEFIKEGDQVITVYYTYSDNDGKVYETEHTDYNINVTSYVEKQESNVNAQDSRKNTMNHFATYGVLLVCCIALWIIFLKYVGMPQFKRKKKDGKR